MQITSLNAAPQISTQISSSLATPVVGQRYTLTCSVTGAEGIEITTTYRWIKTFQSHSIAQVGTNSEILSFVALRLSDAGIYSCEAVVSFSLLRLNTTTTSNTWNLTLQSELVHV